MADKKLAQVIHNVYCKNCQNNDGRGGRKFEVQQGEHSASFNFSCYDPWFKECWGINKNTHSIEVFCKNYRGSDERSENVS